MLNSRRITVLPEIENFICDMPFKKRYWQCNVIIVKLANTNQWLIVEEIMVVFGFKRLMILTHNQ